MMLPAAFSANARTMPTGARRRSSSIQRRARMTLVTRARKSMRATAHQLWTRAWDTTSGSETVRIHSHNSARPKAVCTPRRNQRFMPAPTRSTGPGPGFPSRDFLDVQGGTELGAVEPAVPARRGQGRMEAALADRPVQSRLADTQEPGRLARAHQLGAFGLVLEPLGKSLDIPGVEAPVAARRDQGRPQETARHSTQNRGLAHAKSSCYILRTDQSVQRRVLEQRIINESESPAQSSCLGFQE